MEELNIEQQLQSRLGNEEQLLLELERDKFNTYASSKSVSQELLNTSIIQAHIGIFLAIFATRDSR